MPPETSITDREWNLLVSKIDEVAGTQKEQSNDMKSINAAIHELIGHKKGQEKQIYDIETSANDALNLSRKNRDEISLIKSQMATLTESSGDNKTTLVKWSDRTFDLLKVVFIAGIGALLTYIGLN